MTITIRKVLVRSMCWLVLGLLASQLSATALAAPLTAGVGKADITDRDARPVNDPLYAKALVVSDGTTTAVLITLDAVSIGEIGYIRNDYLGTVREGLWKALKIKPEHVIVNASHCHGIVRKDVAELTIQAVKDAAKNLVAVKVGAGAGFENRIQENRRLKLKDGRETDVRHAYSMPRDEDVAEIGPIDPQIGLLRLDRLNGQPLAAVYNFACHPIQGVPSGGNTADIPAFASQVIEENLGDGVMAFFVQGCGGDINPVTYKAVNHPRDAEPLGNMLGLSSLRGLRKIETKADASLKVVNEILELPRSADYATRLAAMETERETLLKSLRGTSLNFKTFLPLYVQYRVNGEHPSYYSHRYMLDEKLGRDDLKRLDTENRANMDAYLRNIETMERLTRLQTNMDLLVRHQARTEKAAMPTLPVEVVGLRIGDFQMVTFPGELTVEIGLEIKKRATKPHTFVAGYTNGYIYYTPTAEQRRNPGYAQEDCDSLVAPEWRALFDERVDALLKKL